MKTESSAGWQRRDLLKGGAVIAAGVALASPAQAAPAATTITAVDTSHATPEVVRFFAAYFRDKSSGDPDATMAHFTPKPFAYIDAILGWPFYTWPELHDLFATVMPGWPEGARSYPTRIIGDATSAVVYFTNNAGLFGPSEMLSIGVVNFAHGKAARWIDYWDGRHFGIANLDGAKLPDDEFPADFRESLVGETADPRLRRVAAALNQALASGDHAGAAALFAPDATFTDLVAHVQVAGTRHITSFLTQAGPLLPYAAGGTKVRHTVGSAAGGGYEWTATGAVPRGLNTLELDRSGKITDFAAMWDGARATDDHLLRLAAAAIER
jgi:TAT (twin-arginine translocation) pathway signal sequence